MACSGVVCNYHCYSFSCIDRIAYSTPFTVEGVPATFPYNTGANEESDPSVRIYSEHITDLRAAINQERNRRMMVGYGWNNAWSSYDQYPNLGYNYTFVATAGVGSDITGDNGAQLGEIEELSLAIDGMYTQILNTTSLAWTQLNYKPASGGFVRASQVDYIRDRLEQLRKECICDSDCGNNWVCPCHNNCGDNYCDERLKENIVYL